MLSIALLTLVAAPAPAAESDCTVTPGNIEFFTAKAPGFKRTVVSVQEAHETLARKDGVIVKASASGCAHVGVQFSWEGLQGTAPTTWSALLDLALTELKRTPFRAEDHLHKHFIEVLTASRRRATPADTAAAPPEIDCGEFTTCAVRAQTSGARTFVLIIDYDFAA